MIKYKTTKTTHQQKMVLKMILNGHKTALEYKTVHTMRLHSNRDKIRTCNEITDGDRTGLKVRWQIHKAVLTMR